MNLAKFSDDELIALMERIYLELARRADAYPTEQERYEARKRIDTQLYKRGIVTPYVYKSAREELNAQIARRQRKRPQDPANQETAERYEQLLAQHGGKRGGVKKALLALVALPEERGKDYAVRYRKTKDYERLRQDVKGYLGYQRKDAR